MGPLHAYALASRLEAISKHPFTLNQGTLYASLVRLDQKGWIKGVWGTTENNREAKYYELTKAGARALEKQTRALAPARRSGRCPGAGEAMRATLRRFLARLVAFLRPGLAERELTREIAAHLALIEEDYQARRDVRSRRAASRRGRRSAASTRPREIHRDHRSFPWLEDLRRDVPYALRAWRRHPGFTLAAVLTVALGVGASTAIFSIINTILLKPLPYRNAERLVQIAENVTRNSDAGPVYSRRFGLTQVEFLEWRARTTSYEHMAGVINLMSGQLHTADGPVAAPRAIVSPALFEMLGVAAQLGRTLIPEDERPNADAAVISAAAWQHFFGSDPSVLGRQVTLNNTSFTIVGVMPPGFDYPERATMFWTPLAPRPGPGTNPFGNVVATAESRRVHCRSDRRSECDRLGAPRDTTHHGLRGSGRAAAGSCDGDVGRPTARHAGSLQSSALRGPPRQRPHRRSDPAADESAWRRGLGGSVDRMCQYREPAVGPRHRETTRDRRTPRNWRWTWTNRPADRDRECTCWRWRVVSVASGSRSAPFAWSRSWRPSRHRVCFSSPSISVAVVSCLASPNCGVDGSLLLIAARDFADRWPGVRPGAGPATFHGRTRLARSRPGDHERTARTPGGCPSPQLARRDASQPGHDAAGRGRSARAQFREAASGRSRVRSTERADFSARVSAATTTWRTATGRHRTRGRAPAVRSPGGGRRVHQHCAVPGAQ